MMDNYKLDPSGWDELWLKRALWIIVVVLLLHMVLSWWDVAETVRRDTETRISGVVTEQTAILKRLDEQARFNDQVRKAIRGIGGRI